MLDRFPRIKNPPPSPAPPGRVFFYRGRAGAGALHAAGQGLEKFFKIQEDFADIGKEIEKRERQRKRATGPWPAARGAASGPGGRCPPSFGRHSAPFEALYVFLGPEAGDASPVPSADLLPAAFNHWLKNPPES